MRLHPGRCKPWLIMAHQLKWEQVSSNQLQRQRPSGQREAQNDRMHHKLLQLTVKPKRNTQHQTDTDEHLYLLNNNTKTHIINTWPLSTSKCCRHISNIQRSEHNYISTNQSELFSNWFFTTFPLYNPTQFGPINTLQNTFTLSHFSHLRKENKLII